MWTCRAASSSAPSRPNWSTCTRRSAITRSPPTPPNSRAAAVRDYFTGSLNAGALVRLDVDSLLLLDRNLETRASYAIDATASQEYEIPPDSDLLAAMKQGVTSGQLNGMGDTRARPGAAPARSGAVRGPAHFRQLRRWPAAGMDRVHARPHPRRGRPHGTFLAVAGHRLSGRRARSRRLAGRHPQLGACFAAHLEPADPRGRAYPHRWIPDSA